MYSAKKKKKRKKKEGKGIKSDRYATLYMYIYIYVYILFTEMTKMFASMAHHFCPFRKLLAGISTELGWNFALRAFGNLALVISCVWNKKRRERKREIIARRK